MQGIAQVIPSVPLVGPVGLSTVPAGWTLIDESPDFESLPLAPVWAGWGPLPSDLTGLPPGVDRICYTHCLDHWGPSTLKGESFGIEITGLTIGETYSFETYTGGSNHFAGTSVDDVHSSMWVGESVAAIEALGDSPTQIGRDVTTDLNFILETWTFTATNTTMWIALGPSSDSFRDLSDIGVLWALVNPDVEVVSDTDCDDIPNPIADFEFIVGGVSSEDGATGACIVNPVLFNDLSTVGDPEIIDTWFWEFGDGGTSTDENPEHTYAAGGTYTITLTVTTESGCTDTYTLDIVMTDGLSMDIIFNDPTCHGFTDGSVTVNVTGELGELIFVITDEAGTVINEDNSNTANTLGEGWYYINVDDDSECSGIDSVYLTDPGELDIEIDLIDPLCFGDETGIAVVTEVINYTGSDDMISYIWNPNPGGNSGVGEDSTWAMGAGDYTVTINDENGCSKVFDFTITEPTQMTFPEFGFEHAFCRLHEYQSGNGVVFGSASGGTPDYSYVWTNLDNGDESINSTWGGLNPGNYELTATDANGCILQETLFLDSLNPVAAFTVVSDQLNTDCQGTATIEVEFVNESINFANPNDPGADTTFLWNLDNPNAAWQVSHDVFEVFDTIFTPQGQTYYVDVCLVALNKNGCADTTCKVVTVYEPISFDDVNIFSPNGDGINDEFTFEFKAASIAEFTCVIVNRWGIVVHEMDDINDGWDGTDKNGDPCTDGVYFYKYVAKTDNSTDIVGQGSLQIVMGN